MPGVPQRPDTEPGWAVRERQAAVDSRTGHAEAGAEGVVRASRQSGLLGLHKNSMCSECLCSRSVHG